jgi:hypothetical protein
MRGDKRLDHACQLWTHYLGWEIRLEINRDLQRSEPSRRTEILTASSTGISSVSGLDFSTA